MTPIYEWQIHVCVLYVSVNARTSFRVVKYLFLTVKSVEKRIHSNALLSFGYLSNLA